MLKAENVHKSFDDIHVLRGVDLSIDKGEFVSIVGKSGSGKSTLLHILGSLDQPDSGKVIANETNVFALNEKDLADFRNRNIGFVFQFHHLLAEFNAVENVCIPAYIKGTEKSKAEKRAKELLDYLGLSERLDHKPNQLSGGEQQRVAIARALVNNPAIIFADEPTGNLDKSTSEELHKLFFKLREELDQTFVIVTHDLELAKLSDRSLTMVDGKIV